MTEWLIDTSALVRIIKGSITDTEAWRSRIGRGLVHLAMPTRLELGYSARSGQDYELMMTRPPIRHLVDEYVTPKAEKRAQDVQRLLANAGTHRVPGAVDLIVAATAEVAGLTVLHLDKDFEIIADVTGQPVERLT